jgi:predicted metallo-beta-lactamase superfamily hydrolase
VRLEILAAESLGVRGLCCRVEAAGRAIVIDPGVALGYWRFRLLPHPVQVAAGRAARRRIMQALEGATDVVFSHFHGDHVPLRDANPYQLALRQLPPNITAWRAWSKSPDGETHKSQARARDLADLLGARLVIAEGLA